MVRRYILHIAKDYSFEILRPLQDEIWKRGDECIWFVGSKAVDRSRFKSNESVIEDVYEAERYKADAVFSPGNNVPSFLRGLKVHVFHGLEWKKKGHFRIRDFFDLYCTHGPATTKKFDELASKHKHFLVRETGWPKLDPLFETEPYPLDASVPVVLYAPTFSPSLSSAYHCLNEIRRLSEGRQWFWLIKFHPMMNKEIVDAFKAIQRENLLVVENSDVLPLMRRADVMLSDTSSVVGEFLLLNRPVVTFRNSLPSTGLLDVRDVVGIEGALEYALSKPERLSKEIVTANEELHPYHDGKCSSRVLDQVEDILRNKVSPARNRPRNLFRNFKLNRKLGYRGGLLSFFGR